MKSYPKSESLIDIDLKQYPQVDFGKNVHVKAASARIGAGTVIGDNVVIEAENIDIGFDSTIEYGTGIGGIGKDMESLFIGDNCFIGFNNRILTPVFSMSDYSQLHNSCLCSGYKPLNIGYNCWIGQGAILNCYESLTLGDNVRMGGSQIWTHVASGELMEGSNFFGALPVVLEDDVWLMGFGHLVTPGVVLAKGTVVMAGAVVTKSTRTYGTYAGNPARDISEKLPAWKKMSLADKVELAKRFISEFISHHPAYSEKILFMGAQELTAQLAAAKKATLPDLIVTDRIDLGKYRDAEQSIFDLTSKTYLKRRSRIEIDWIMFNIGYRSRFVPFKG